MLVARRHRRFTLWLATLAMVFAVLAPTVSHALALMPGSSGWVEVCTVDGARWVAAKDAGDAQPAGPVDAATKHFDPCPFCHHAGQGMAPPPAAEAQTLQPPPREGLPERFFCAPNTAHAWRAAQPRAPPLLS
jgi:hypothetical protein